MEAELEHCNSQNMQLELNIDELRQKLKSSEKEMLREREKVTRDCTEFMLIFSQSVKSKNVQHTIKC